MDLIVSLIAGVIGGNAAGAVLKPLNLGLLGNSLAGLVGGFAGWQVTLQMETVSALTMQSSSGAAGVMAVLLAAASGGFCLTLVGGLLRQFTTRG